MIFWLPCNQKIRNDLLCADASAMLDWHYCAFGRLNGQFANISKSVCILMKKECFGWSS
jgi:hypothetical protein